MKIAKRLLILFLLLALPSVCWGATHYCDTAAEINTAFANHGTGDTIAIKCGITYDMTSYSGGFSINANNVTVDAYYGTSTLVGASGNFAGNTRPVLDFNRRTILSYNSAIIANGRTGTTIRNIEIREFGGYGITFQGDATGTVYNVHIKQNSYHCLRAYQCDAGTITFDSVLIEEGHYGSDMGAVLQIRDADNVTVSNSIIRYTRQVTGGEGIIILQGNNIKILNNQLYSNPKNLGIQCSRDVTIAGNLFYDDHAGQVNTNMSVYMMEESRLSWLRTNFNKYIRFYDNMFADTNTYSLNVNKQAIDPTGNHLDHVLIAHNTFVELDNNPIRIDTDLGLYDTLDATIYSKSICHVCTWQKYFGDSHTNAL